MKRIPINSTSFGSIYLLMAALLCIGGCSDRDAELKLSDLTPGERNFVDKIISVERALAVSYIHRETGQSLLDSLSNAWGDSVSFDLMAELPGDPKRAGKVDELLLRLITAEQDSFKIRPGTNRLHLPLPDLNQPPVPAVPDSNSL